MTWNPKSLIALMAAALVSAIGSGTLSFAAEEASSVPLSAEKTQPLKAGAKLPKSTLKTPEGTSFDLNAAVAKKPALLIVYRGGWCPYCIKHLKEIRTVEKDLVDLGYQIYAISSDRPGKLKEAVKKHGFSYQLLSDSSMEFSRAMGIAFKLEDALVSKYKNEYGIDVEADSGQTHHQLPVPSVFIIGKDGVIKYSHANPDYKSRVPGKEILAKAKDVN